MLTWTQQTDDVVDTYNLAGEYSGPCPNFNEIILRTINGTERGISLTGLQEFSSYSFILTAINKVGSKSTSFSFTTNFSGTKFKENMSCICSKYSQSNF